MARVHLMAAFYAAVIALALWGTAKKTVDIRASADDERLLVGTWNQYCTQLLTMKGAWAMAASEACNHTYPSLEVMRNVLED